MIQNTRIFPSTPEFTPSEQNYLLEKFRKEDEKQKTEKELSVDLAIAVKIKFCNPDRTELQLHADHIITRLQKEMKRRGSVRIPKK